MKRLILFDWDGVIEVPNETSFNIMIEAGESLAPNGKKHILNWQELFRQNQGKTEFEFVRQMARQYGILEDQINDFFKRFIKKRVELIRGKRKSENDNDHIYFDALNFLKTTYPDLVHKPDHTILMLVTGNPRAVMEARIPNSIKPYFINSHGQLLGAFGDEGENRQSLINLAIKIARSTGFRVARDIKGNYTNVFYVDDTLNGVKAGIISGVKTVYLISEREPNDFAAGVEKAPYVLKKLELPDTVYTGGTIKDGIYMQQLYMGLNFHDPTLRMWLDPTMHLGKLESHHHHRKRSKEA